MSILERVDSKTKYSQLSLNRHLELVPASLYFLYLSNVLRVWCII